MCIRDRHRAVSSISVRSLQVSSAIILDESGNETKIDIRLLQHGDIFKVVPDSRIPTDGTVISGSSEVDEATITGESMPVPKTCQSTVVAGSLNITGTLFVKLTTVSYTHLDVYKRQIVKCLRFSTTLSQRMKKIQ